MHSVSLLIECLRGRPRFVFWTAALSQAVLWAVLPALFYAAPPSEVPLLLAIGHEYLLGSYQGPPLAFWLGETAFRIGGLFGVYVLAQAAIVTTYWAVFMLGRAIVGMRHAVLAVLLMGGIAAFTLPSVDFGPAILAAPFWALALLHYWRAAGEDRRGYWFLLAIDLGLLLLTSYVGLILVALLVIFTAGTRARHALVHSEPWIALILLAIVVFPHALWLAKSWGLVLGGLADAASLAGKPRPWLWLSSALIASHFGVVLMVLLASGYPRRRKQRAPEIDRTMHATPLARAYVYCFALLPALVAIAIALDTGRLGPLERVTPLVVLTGLAVILAAGERIHLYREGLVSTAWVGLLVAPPLLAVLSIAVMPWVTRSELAVAQPARAEATFFADSFQRRTGKPLRYVAGDPQLALLVAMAAPSRPHVYFDWAPERSPWASPADLRRDGAVLAWPAPETSRNAPQRLATQFPELVPEVPRSFERPVQGFLPLLRLGWAVIRPAQPQ
ncbi:MAG TPA: glycosyltransferase family 39 protein [Pseudolabrys sp.]|nr:glycosyltransferase family 39 protein [Pseudolabrys sp.]